MQNHKVDKEDGQRVSSHPAKPQPDPSWNEYLALHTMDLYFHGDGTEHVNQ